jgi:myo-inositol-1-phosphate synthase
MLRTNAEKPVSPATGKLAVLMPGLGAVATTFIAGVDAILNGRTAPIGSYALMGHLPEGDQLTLVRDAVPLVGLENMVFGGWDIYEGTAYDTARQSAVLSKEDLEAARGALESVRPMKAVFDVEYVRNIDGPNVKKDGTKWDFAESLVQDIKNFMATNGCERAVGVWCASTERYIEVGPVHRTIEAFEAGLKENHPDIAPSMIYAYAFIKAGVPLANGAPNLALDLPCIVDYAKKEGVAIAGKDFKTGQTLMKTMISPGIAARMIGVHGWYSTNILGNTDGAVLDDPGSFKTKEQSKLSVIESILEKDLYPELYSNMTHRVRIDYYPPRGDNKEGWDNIDIFGWMGYPMQIKINFLCRDSILAAPLVLDLAMFMDLAQRSGMSGVQDWLSFYFKSPQRNGDMMPPHDLFKQRDNLQETLRAISHRTDWKTADGKVASAS